MTNEFIQRELSWIDFNRRVLACALRPETPLDERFKFLAITSSNLDEFISVRYASVLDEADKETQKNVLNAIHRFIDKQYEAYGILKEEARSYGVVLGKRKLPKSTEAKLEKMFDEDIFPVLTPISIGSTNDVPNLISGQSYIVVTVRDGNEEIINLIPIISNIKKMYFIDGYEVMIEDIIMRYLKKLFVNKDIDSAGFFRVIKDANIVLNHDRNKFILDRMNETLMKRKFSKPIFMMASETIPKRIRNILLGLMDLPKSHVYTGDITDLSRFMSPLIGNPDLSYPKFEAPQYEVVGEKFSLFSELNERDILLHHPYDSYDTVVKFIQHAATDPEVLAIKMTLYRVSSENSPIVNALVKAAEKGKQVSVLVEIKARFDEYRNISLIDKLKYAGVNVIMGIEELKTHCKMCVVVRKEDDGVKIYSHLATGNYNEKTAKIYTDISYLTSKQKIGYDLLNIFNIISGVSRPDEKLQRVFYAPVNLRSKLVKLIDREIAIAKSGKKAEIFIKVNSISDEPMVEKLYEAADAGVNITIICRGVCSIVPRKHLRIKSIVGRFLEHSRIYYFRNRKDSEYFISSADLLTRNLDKRVEIMVSLKDSNVIQKMRHIIDVLVNDTYNSFYMEEDGDFYMANGDFDAHQYFIDTAGDAPTIKIPKRNK